MNIIVLGAGAVGGYFGGKLASAGYPVTFLVRQKRLIQLQKNGLQIKSIHGDFSIEPSLTVNVNEIENPNIVIVAIKNYHLGEAIPQLKTLVQKGAKIIPLLNGIEHLETLISNFGTDNVIGGLCSIESTLNEEGNIIQTSALQDIVFGTIGNVEYSFLNELKEMLEKAKINVALSDNVLIEMWKKFIFITSLSGITATLRQPIAAALHDEEASRFLKDLIKEVSAVAQVKGIRFSENIEEATLQKIQSLSPKMTASMHRDLERGLPLELDYLHGYALQVANEHQLNTPCLRSVYALLHPYKNGKVIIEQKI